MFNNSRAHRTLTTKHMTAARHYWDWTRDKEHNPTVQPIFYTHLHYFFQKVTIMLFEDWLQPTGRPGQTEPWDWGSLPGTRCPSYVPPDPGAAVPAVLEHLPSFLSLSPSLSLCSSFCPLAEVGVGEEEQGQNPQLCSMHSLVAESRKHTAGTGCWSRRGMWRNPATHITLWTPNPHNLSWKPHGNQ